MSDKVGCLWFLACIGVIYMAVDWFGEGATAAHLGAVAIFVVTALAFSNSKK